MHFFGHWSEYMRERPILTYEVNIKIHLAIRLTNPTKEYKSRYDKNKNIRKPIENLGEGQNLCSMYPVTKDL